MALVPVSRPAFPQQPQPTPGVDSGRPGHDWLAPTLSVVIPGTGQLLQRQDRGALYLLVEALVLQRFVSHWTEARADEAHYRDLAFSVARAPFGPIVRDTVFEYFEQMSAFIESGPFDTDDGAPLVPPLDESTYNGSVWALARATYFPNGVTPGDTTSLEYRAAINFYRRRAVGPNFQWSWQDAGLEQDVFRQTIRDGDETFRRAQRQLGLLLANHLLSAVDAFMTRRMAGPSAPGSLGHRVWLDHQAGQTSVHFLIGVGFSSGRAGAGR